MHAPAPTAIYPLSLHDALPIFHEGNPVGSDAGREGRAAHLLVTFLPIWSWLALRPLRHGRRTRLPGPDHIRAPRLEALDRKSTRLNSSHGYISYAVFCLKKKTK